MKELTEHDHDHDHILTKEEERESVSVHESYDDQKTVFKEIIDEETIRLNNELVERSRNEHKLLNANVNVNVEELEDIKTEELDDKLKAYPATKNEGTAT
jgi:hypothetical protein